MNAPIRPGNVERRTFNELIKLSDRKGYAMVLPSFRFVPKSAPFKSRSLFVFLFALVAAAFVAFADQARADETRGRLTALVVRAGSFDDSGLKELVGNDLRNKQRVVETSATAVAEALKDLVGEENRDDVETLGNA